jgi:hypothetical protein
MEKVGRTDRTNFFQFVDEAEQLGIFDVRYFGFQESAHEWGG